HSPSLIASVLPPFIFLSLSLFLVTLLSFHNPSTSQIFTLSLHDALPISSCRQFEDYFYQLQLSNCPISYPQHSLTLPIHCLPALDRKSTRLNSSHVSISYAVFCLKKKTIILIILLHYIIS